MERRLQHLHEDTFSLYTQLTKELKWAQEQAKANSDSMEYCADIAFAMNELDKLIKDIGVEVRKTRELAEMLACRTWIVEDRTGEPIRTEHCTATPDLKLRPATPKKGTPELAELLSWLGLDKNQAAVRIHWPTLCDIVTECKTEGKPLPKCLNSDAMHNPSATLKFYKRKDVTE